MTTSHLNLIVVSEDWFGRRLLTTVAADSGLFDTVSAVDDGYSALAETWEGVEQGDPPNVFLIDSYSVGPSAARLIIELRNDPTTSRSYIAVLTPGETGTTGGIDFISPCNPAAAEIGAVVESIAAAARLTCGGASRAA